MTNNEKLSEVFPNTIFIYQKQDGKTRAIMCTDEWLNNEYQDDNQNKRAEQEPMLDKLRAEIEELKPNNPNFKGYFEQNVALNKVLEVIDKYKAESEAKR